MMPARVNGKITATQVRLIDDAGGELGVLTLERALDLARSRGEDLLEAAHPEAFDNTDAEACRRGSELMRDFLREHLRKDKIEVNEDAFGMLCSDFFCSHHFYSRMDDYRRKKG